MNRVALLPVFVAVCFLGLSKVHVLGQSSTQNAVKEVLKILWKCNFTTEKPIGGTCRGDSFPCNNGICVPLSWKCDGKPDCLTGEDEATCKKECPPGEFKCKNNRCIKLKQICDQQNDCEDGEDEKTCFSMGCRANTVPCNNGLCIPVSWRCDGKKDCLAGEDEEFCRKKCNTTLPCKELPWYQEHLNKTLLSVHKGLIQTTNSLDKVKSLPGALNAFPYGDVNKTLGSLTTAGREEEKQNNLLKGLDANFGNKTSQELEQLTGKLQQILGNISSGLGAELEKVNFTLSELRSLLQNLTELFPGVPRVTLTEVAAELNQSRARLNNSLAEIEKNITEEIDRVANATRTTTLLPTTVMATTAPPPPTTTTTTTIALSPLVLPEKVIIDELKKLNQSTNLIYKPTLGVGTGGCKLGFTKLNGGCYYISSDTGRYASVSFICKDWGGHLVNIGSPAEEQILKAKITATAGTHQFYHGANDILSEDSFVWDDKWEWTSYSNWGDFPYYKKFPNALYKLNCAAMTNQYTFNGARTWVWREAICNGALSWVCEQNQTEETSNVIKNETMEDFTTRLKDFKESVRLVSAKYPVNSTSKCPAGFWKKSTGCYYLSRDVAEWYTASYRCKDLGGWVSDVPSAQEQQDIDSILADTSFRGNCIAYWIGLHGLNRQGAILSDKTYKPPIYTKWKTGPVNKEHCVYYQETDKRWYHSRCFSENCFICKTTVSP